MAGRRRPRRQRVVDVPRSCSSLMVFLCGLYIRRSLSAFHEMRFGITPSHLDAELVSMELNEFRWSVLLVIVNALFAFLYSLFPRCNIFRSVETITEHMAQKIGAPLTGIEFVLVTHNARGWFPLNKCWLALGTLFCMDFFFNIKHLGTLLPLLGVLPVIFVTFENFLTTDVFLPSLISSCAVIISPILSHRMMGKTNLEFDVMGGGQYIFRIGVTHWLNIVRLIGMFCNMVCLCNLLLMNPSDESLEPSTPMPFMSYFSLNQNWRLHPVTNAVSESLSDLNEWEL